MTYASGPLQPLPLDRPGQRRRRLATGAGIVAVAGIVVAGMTFANRPARQPVSAPGAVGGPPSSAAVAPPQPSVAAAPAPSVTVSPTSAPAATAGSLDVDGDGRPDVAAVRFITRRTAKVVVHLGTGKSLSSKAFPVYRGAGGGALTPLDINGDHRSELLVTDPGADGTGYELFTIAGGALVEVAAPGGQEQPFLYSGGGMYYQSSFGCTDHRLVITREKPQVRSTANLPADPRFTVTTTTYALAGARLSVVSSHAATVPNRAAAATALARTANACGAKP